MINNDNFRIPQNFMCVFRCLNHDDILLTLDDQNGFVVKLPAECTKIRLSIQ
jgi:hypothetical protein